MGMALIRFAVVGQFKMPSAVPYVGLVNNIVPKEHQQSPINCCFIRGTTQLFVNLF